MPRITRIAVNGLRVLESVELRLSPMTVLIGQNGSGKSSLVEACELLRRAGDARVFVDELYRRHDGRALMRTPSSGLGLGATVEDGDVSYDYRFELDVSPSGALGIAAEILTEMTASGERRTLIQRSPEIAMILAPSPGHGLTPVTVGRDTLLLASGSRGVKGDPIDRVRHILASILVYTPLDTSPDWARREQDPGHGPRSSVLVRPAIAVDRGAGNLPNAYHTLRNNPARWSDVMDVLRLGLGDDLLDVTFPADPGGGHIGLSLDIDGVGSISSRYLADGQLAYLAMVATRYLVPEACPLLAFDEPDHHLHPDLARLVIGLLGELAEDRSVLLTTHSDRMLDLVQDPAESVVLLAAREHRTILRRPAPEALDSWLKDHRGIGELRADGLASMVFPPEH